MTAEPMGGSLRRTGRARWAAMPLSRVDPVRVRRRHAGLAHPELARSCGSTSNRAATVRCQECSELLVFVNRGARAAGMGLPDRPSNLRRRIHGNRRSRTAMSASTGAPPGSTEEHSMLQVWIRAEGSETVLRYPAHSANPRHRKRPRQHRERDIGEVAQEPACHHGAGDRHQPPVPVMNRGQRRRDRAASSCLPRCRTPFGPCKSRIPRSSSARMNAASSAGSKAGGRSRWAAGNR